jgi:hypothetical protein
MTAARREHGHVTAAERGRGIGIGHLVTHHTTLLAAMTAIGYGP